MMADRSWSSWLRESRTVRTVAWAIFIAAAVHVVAVFAFAPVLPEDDAFITLKYAANLAEGNGFVFNPGERVLGTTSPADTLLLAAVGAVAGPGRLAAAAVTLNGLWIVLTGVAALLLFEGLGLRSPLPELAAAWLMLSPQVLEMGLGGMEVCLFAFTAVAALALAVRSRWAWAAGMASLSVLVRPEGAVVLGILALYWWRSGRPQAVPVAVAAGSILGGWALFAGLYFGSPIPQSVLAKVHASGIVAAGSAARRLAAEASAWLLGGRVNPAAASFAAPQAAVVVLTLLLIAAVVIAAARGRVRPAAVWIPAWLVLAAAGYAIANPYWFPWYAMMVLIPWWLTFVVGIGSLDAAPARWSWAPLTMLAIIVLAQGIGAVGAATLPNWPAAAYGISTPYRARILSYAEAARWLNAHAADGSELLSGEIGMLGFVYRRGPIIDAWGLVTPEAAAFSTSGSIPSGQLGTIPPELVRAERPAFVVGFPMFLGRLNSDGWFGQNYRFIRFFDVPGRSYPMYRLELYALGPP